MQPGSSVLLTLLLVGLTLGMTTRMLLTTTPVQAVPARRPVPPVDLGLGLGVAMGGTTTLRPAAASQRPAAATAAPPPPFRVVVLTMSRKASLLRLLRSLESAQYDGDEVVLEVRVDSAKPGMATGDVQGVVQAARAFAWSHGQLQVRAPPRVHCAPPPTTVAW